MKRKLYEFPLGIFFKKFNCHDCGSRLERKKISCTLREGDEGYREAFRATARRHTVYQLSAHEDIEVKSYILACPKCGKRYSYNEMK